VGFGAHLAGRGVCMKKKTAVVALVGVLALLSTSCLFSMQGFAVLKGQIKAGEKTTAQFILHPSSTDKLKGFQFVLLGTDRTDAIKTLRPVWGTNGAFGGPVKMLGSSALPGAMAIADCTSGGISFSDLSGFTWKGYLTPNEVGNRGKPAKQVIVQGGVKALADSDDALANIAGVTGVWVDDGDGLVNSADSFLCTGIAITNVFVKGAAA